MRNIILGTIAGLLVGAAGALGYSQLAGDGNALADLKSQLADASAKLAKAQADERFLTEQKNSESAQLDEVLKSKQAAGTTDANATAAAAPVGNPLTIGGMAITPDMVRGFMSMMGRGGPGGGFRSPEQRAFLLQSRLKLTPDQAKSIKDAMDADNKARRDAFRAARQNGGQVDQAALAAANSLDKTMASMLSPSQLVQYQQVQADEKQARAESQATQQVDNMMPLLQLSDDQKSKLMNSLYQQQLSQPDTGGQGGPGGPGGFGGGPGGGGGNPLAALAQQGQAINTAMKSVLSSDQYALYQQNEQVQQQAMGNFGGGGPNGGQNGGVRRNRQNGGDPGAVGAGAPAVPATAPVTTDTTASTATSTGTATTGTTTATGTTTDSTSTTTPSATTNAASGTPPAN